MRLLLKFLDNDGDACCTSATFFIDANEVLACFYLAP